MTFRSRPRGSRLGITWGVIANDGETFRSTLTIANGDDVRLPERGWAIFFNACRKPLSETVTGNAIIEHVNGDLFKLSPSRGFEGLEPGASWTVTYASAFWAVLASDAPLGFFIVHDEGTPDAQVDTIGDPEVLPIRSTAQYHRSPSDKVPRETAASRFAANGTLSILPDERVGRITPTPSAVTFTSGTFILSQRTPLAYPSTLEREGAFLRKALSRCMTHPLPSAGTATSEDVRLRLEGELPLPTGGVAAEGYRLSVGPGGVEIAGRTPRGVFYGIQTFLQLLSVRTFANGEPAWTLTHVEIADAPRFEYRGFHLDVARNFSDKRTVLDLLDMMALYKLNAFHFHLTDDEGWRVPIRSLPELTEIGSRRGYTVGGVDLLPPSFGSGPEGTGAPGSGAYTEEEFVEILRHARDRHIEVIPEIDLPGHARAAIQAMRTRAARLRAAGRAEEASHYLLDDDEDTSTYESVQLWKDNVVCIGLPSCLRFIETVVADIHAMYDAAGVPLSTVHVGGDEVPRGAWEQSPVCQDFMREHGMTSLLELQNHFFARFRDILARHGARMAGWEEVAVVTEEFAEGPVSTPNLALLGSRLRPYIWNNVWGWGREDIAYRLANAGYEVVLSSVTNLYLDLAYEKDPDEPGYYWGGFLSTRKVFEYCPLDIFTTATVDIMGNALDAQKIARMERLTPAGGARVLGIQGHLWGENLRSRARTEYLLMPRLIAVAERAWAEDPGWTRIADGSERAARMDQAWNEFANRLGQRELPRLDGSGVSYRVPVPGAILECGVLSANIEAPGMTLRYTLDGSEPTTRSTLYEGPLVVPRGSSPKVAAFTSAGRKGRTITPDPDLSR